MDAARIERSVEDTIRTAQYTIADRSVDVIHIAKNLGFLVGNAILNDEDDGFIVVEEGKDKKVIVYKYKRKTGYHKKNGHRQAFTKVKIDKINA